MYRLHTPTDYSVLKVVRLVMFLLQPETAAYITLFG